MRYFTILIVVLVLNLVIVAGGYFYVSKKVDSNSALILQTQKQINELGKGKVSNYFYSSSDMIDAHSNILQQLQNQFRFESRLLQDFVSLIPQQVWLIEFEQKNSELNLTGYALSNEDLAVFLDNLTKNSLFKKVLLSYSKPALVSGQKVYQFKVECNLGVDK